MKKEELIQIMTDQLIASTRASAISGIPLTNEKLIEAYASAIAFMENK